MAKLKLPKQRDMMQNLKRRIEKYMLLVQGIYDTYNLEAAKMAVSVGYDGEKPFRFSSYPQTSSLIEKAMNNWCKDMNAVIYRTTSEEWKKSNLIQDLIADKVMAYYYGSHNGKRVRKYYQVNSDALKAFQERRDYGMNLSQRIWNQSRQYKRELEDALSVGIQKGMSAVTLSKRISKYLNDFPSLQKDYKEKYGKATDCVNCEYRSMRLARNEINLAYRTAEQKRWEQMDFIIGKEIKTSDVHDERMPKGDICDQLAGKYPKDFLWRGWHVNCMCYEVPIIKKDYDFFAPDDKPADREVTDVPENYKEWIKQNAERIEKAKERGTLPYFLKDNPSWKKYLEPSTLEKAEERHKARTPEEIEDIKKRWAEHEHKNELIVKTADNILKVAKDYGEVDVTKLEEAIASGNLNEMRDITRAYATYLSAVKKEEKALSDLIPNAHELHKQFTMDELKKAHEELNGVMSKWLTKYSYASLDSAPLAHLKNKLDFELTQPTFNYSQKGLVDKILRENINAVEKRIEWNSLVDKANSLMSFKTKSPKYRDNLISLEEALRSNDFDKLKNSITEAEKQQQRLIDAQMKRRGGEVKTALNPEYKGGVIGKDITSTIDTRTMTSEDPYDSRSFTNNIARMQGYDAPAKLVSEKEFVILENNCEDVFYRTVNSATFNGKKMSAEEFASQMYKADKMELNGPGGRFYGDGMYVATARWDGTDVNPLTERSKNRAYFSSEGYGQKTLEMTWARIPKIIKERELQKIWDNLEYEEQLKFGRNRNTYACALGYDAMYCDGPDYMVIWNRSIIAVKKE